MARLKKAFAWLVVNFPNTLNVCWMPVLVIQDFLHPDDLDGWDYGMDIIIFVIFAIGLVSDIITYRKKIAKKEGIQ